MEGHDACDQKDMLKESVAAEKILRRHTLFTSAD